MTVQTWKEDSFARQLVADELVLPEGLASTPTVKPTKRFAVYRNNVRGALVEALAVRYPVVQRLVGEEFFRVMAAEFAIHNLPRSPVLISYGADFPDFVESFEPARSLPYLPDVARLESAHWQAYHAEDDVPLTVDAFHAVPPDQLADSRFDLIAACQILSSPHPIVSIWQTNTRDETVTPVDLSLAEEALVSRPGLSVEVRKLPRGSARFLLLLQQGSTLGEAAEIAASESPAFDLTQNFAGLIQTNIVKAII